MQLFPSNNFPQEFDNMIVKFLIVEDAEKLLAVISEKWVISRTGRSAVANRPRQANKILRKEKPGMFSPEPAWPTYDVLLVGGEFGKERRTDAIFLVSEKRVQMER